MIFSPQLAKLVQRGRKTATRRRAVGSQPRCRYQPGHSYAVQPGRGKKQICRILIAAVELEPLTAIDFAQVRAEGFSTTAEFAHYWRKLYEQSYDDDTRPDDDHDLIDHWKDRYAHVDVWAITFTLDNTHRPRLLTPASRGEHDGDEHGYTDNPTRALRDEPEAIDASLANYYAADARQRFAGLPGQREEQLRRQARSLATRVRQVAAADRVDMAGTLGHLDQITEHVRLLERSRHRAA